LVVEKCITFLGSAVQLPGLFRVSGSQNDVLAYKAAFDRGEDVDLSNCSDPHVVANILKLYLRELPNPLLTAEMYPKFIEAFSASQDTAVERLRVLINNLPNTHKTTLQYLIQFLTVVASQSAVNMMTPLNLGTVFGPTILRPGKEESMADAGKMEMANAITEKIIQNFEVIFPYATPVAHAFAAPSQGFAPIPAFALPPPIVVQAPLPEGWSEHVTADGRLYYSNAATQTTTWDRPVAAPAQLPPLLIPPLVEAPPTVLTPKQPHRDSEAPRPASPMVSPVPLARPKPVPIPRSNSGSVPPASPVEAPPDPNSKVAVRRTSAPNTPLNAPLSRSLAATPSAPSSTPSTPIPTPIPAAASPPVNLEEKKPIPVPIPRSKPPAPAPRQVLHKRQASQPSSTATTPVPPSPSPLAQSAPISSTPTTSTPVSLHITEHQSFLPPVLSLDVPEVVNSTPEARIQSLEAKVAQIERKQAETNDILANVLAQLQQLTDTQ